MQKCFNIMITGKVQDIGFRSLIEDIGRLYDIRGFTFNDIDGSIKMVCCGENGVVADFLEEFIAKGAQRGAVIEKITRKEIPFEIYLPQRFLRLYTDELADIGRKLDKGNDELEKINTKLASMDGKLFSVDEKLFSVDEKLASMDGKLFSVDEKLASMDEKLYTLNSGVNNLNTTLSSFVVEQREHSHILEKILEKLVEK